MSELSYILLNSKADKFDCGNATINEYIEWSYFVTLSQQCYAYKILYKSLIVASTFLASSISPGFTDWDLSNI